LKCCNINSVLDIDKNPRVDVKNVFYVFYSCHVFTFFDVFCFPYVF